MRSVNLSSNSLNVEVTPIYRRNIFNTKKDKIFKRTVVRYFSEQV